MTKVHITNLYGMAGDSTVILAQNAVTDIALFIFHILPERKKY